MRKIIYLVMLLSFTLSAFAQNTDDVAPMKGDWMFSVNFGVGSYIGTSAPKPNLSNYSLSAPMTAWFDKNPILDMEARWLVANRWALKMTGGFNYGNNPGYTELTGTASGEIANPGDVPTYKAVPNSDNIQFFIGIGVDHYFKTKWSRVFLRVGGELGFAYGRVTVNGEDDIDYMGAAIGEAYAFKVAPVLGADYFFNQALFLGFDIRPIAYQYSMYSERPQAGLNLLSSDNHSFSILSQPMIKLGLRF
ncbi:MAG: hypothetical protein LBV43_12185 [Prevotella sp.]|jgi:hypothetical protein|nr:hypothetical protein [Prevotella sp.]